MQTETYDPDAIVSISSNQFTPISGDYLLIAWAVAGAATGINHRIRLYNVTSAASIEEGINSQSAAGVRATANLICKFTANGTDAYRIDHYTSTGLATTGLGIAVSDGSPEVYMEIRLIKVA